MEERAAAAEKAAKNGRNKELYNITKTIAGEKEETRSRRERQTRGAQDRSARNAAEMGGALQ